MLANNVNDLIIDELNNGNLIQYQQQHKRWQILVLETAIKRLIVVLNMVLEILLFNC